MSKECKHEITQLVEEEFFDDWEETTETILVEKTRTTFEDIDLHRFKCSLCGEIGYYSSWAKEHFGG